MAYSQVAGIAPQYEDQAGYYLKFYEPSTTTPIAMATDNTGSTLLAKAQLDSFGFINTDGGARFLPFVNRSYDAYLFPTEDEADDNVTINAIRVGDRASPINGGYGYLLSDTEEFTTSELPVGSIVRLTSYYNGGKAIEGLEYVIKTPSEAAADGDVIDEKINFTMSDDNVAILLLKNNTLSINQAGGDESINTNEVALLAAMNYSINKCELLIPDGVFECGSRTKFLGTGKLVIKGSGTLKAKSGYTIAITSLDNTNAIIEIYMSNTEGDIVDISGVTFDGNRTGNSYSTWLNSLFGIKVKYAEKVRIDNISSINSPSTAIRVSTCNEVTVSNNKSENNFYHGISVKVCTDVNVKFNSIFGIGDAGTDPDAGGIGILLTDTRKSKVIGNSTYNTSDTAIKIEGYQDAICSENIVENCGKDGIKVQGIEDQLYGEPENGVISDNIVKNLYEWRTDGTTCIQLSDSKYMTVTGNVVESVGTSTNRIGIRTFNHFSGTVGNAGILNVSTNVVKQTYDETYEDGVSIQVVGADSGGHSFNVSSNISWGRLRVGDGYGSDVISGNLVGPRNVTDPILYGAGIEAIGSNVSISGNVVNSFERGIVYYATTPFNEVFSVSVTGNTIERVSVQGIDIGSFESGSPEINCSINGNVMRNIDVKPIRIRNNDMKIQTLSIVGNTCQGDYLALLETYDTGSPVDLGTVNITGNSEVSTNASYFIPALYLECDRLLGDYAVSPNVLPDTTHSYLRGDVIVNSAPESGRAMNWVCTNATTQVFEAGYILP